MLLSAIDMGGPSIGVELDTHLIGIDLATWAPHGVADPQVGLPRNGWRDPSTAA
jgi:hypothetical protein